MEILSDTGNISFHFNKKTTIQDGDNQVECKSILVKDWAVSVYLKMLIYNFRVIRIQGSIPLRGWQSGLPIQGTIFRNVLNFVHSYQTDGRNLNSDSSFGSKILPFGEISAATD